MDIRNREEKRKQTRLAHERKPCNCANKGTSAFSVCGFWSRTDRQEELKLVDGKEDAKAFASHTLFLSLLGTCTLCKSH